MYMKSRRSLASGIFSFAFLAAVLIALLQRQAIFDWIRVRDYKPPAAIAKLATDTTMNDQTRRIFYVYHPELNDRSTFGSNCPNQAEKTIVLGCYVSQRGIYLFDVTDDRLAGVEEVTAAHEILHATYERLNGDERKKVDDMLSKAFAAVKTERIRATIESYRKAGADINNELHSILGTEVRNLTPELEAYYSRYFKDRSKVVSYSEQYEKAFNDRKALADGYLQQMGIIEKQLLVIKNEIDQMENSLSNGFRALEQERGSTNDPASFNAKVAAYNNQVATYRARVNTHNQLVARHNEILNLYNAIAVEENELIKALDSRPTTVQTQ